MIARLVIVLLLVSSFAVAQMPTPPPPPTPPLGEPGMRHRGDVMYRAVGPGMMGRWWKNAEVVQQLGLSDEQVQRIEQTFQDHRMRLIDIRANLEKAEATLQPMIESNNPNEAAVMKQIDKVATQRAELEKANAQMLFAIRRMLTPEQWKKLQSLKERGPTRMEMPGPGPRGGGQRQRGPMPGPGAPPAGEDQPPLPD